MLSTELQAALFADYDSATATLNGADLTPAERDPIVAKTAEARAMVAALPTTTLPPPTGPPGPTTADLIVADGISVAAVRQLSSSLFEFDADPDPVRNKTAVIDVGLAANCAGVALDFRVRLKHGAAVPWWAWGTQTPITFYVSQAPPWDVWDTTVTTLASDMNLADQSVLVRLPALPGPGRRISSTPVYTNAMLDAEMAGVMRFALSQSSIEGRPIYRYTIGTGPKGIVLHRAGHANERPRDHFMGGAAAWLLSPAGAAARAAATWHFYVRPSPDTWQHGWARMNAGGNEQNRYLTGQTGNGPEQDAVIADVLALAPRVFIDLHTSGDKACDRLVWGPGSNALAAVNPVNSDTQGWYCTTQPETWTVGADGSQVSTWSHRRFKEWGVPATGLIDTGGKSPVTVTKMRIAGQDFVREIAARIGSL